MSEASNGQEKTQEATPKRKQDARKKGQIVRSKELSTAFVTITGVIGLWVFASFASDNILSVMHQSFQFKQDTVIDVPLMMTHFKSVIYQVALVVLPLLGMLFVVAIIASCILGGWAFTFNTLVPKLERLNALKGIKKMFSVKSLVELIKALLKFFLILSIGAILMWHYGPTLLSLAGVPTSYAIAGGLNIFVIVLFGLMVGLFIVAFIDVPYQIWQHMQNLRMSHQEIKDEQKQSDGDPEVKGRVRSIQREMAQKRMMQDIPDAQVVITNPTHYAVAIKYDSQPGETPCVVAKGVDHMAENIKQVARDNHVLVFSSPMLARAIYFSTEIGSPIPQGLFVAVARVLAYVYQLKQFKTGNGIKPDVPGELPVPEELRR